MTNLQLTTLIRLALTRLRTCQRHDIPLENGGCHLCVLESRMGRGQRTVRQIMAGEVLPSWERGSL